MKVQSIIDGEKSGTLAAQSAIDGEKSGMHANQSGNDGAQSGTRDIKSGNDAEKSGIDTSQGDTHVTASDDAVGNRRAAGRGDVRV